jgi:hypothetical protein
MSMRWRTRARVIAKTESFPRAGAGRKGGGTWR